MSALLRAVRSFDQNCRQHIRPSEESDMPSGRHIALRASVLITLLGPPAASLILCSLVFHRAGSPLTMFIAQRCKRTARTARDTAI
jgi:hypothetical protein